MKSRSLVRYWRLVLAGAVFLAVAAGAYVFISGQLSWATYASLKEPFFSIKYPKDYQVTEDYLSPLLGPGKEVSGVKFDIPSKLVGATTFAGGYFTVEYTAARFCAGDVFLPGAANTTLTDDGVTYSVASISRSDNTGAFEEKVYAIQGSQPCIAVHYVLNTANKAGYDPNAPPAQERPPVEARNFNPDEAHKVFDTMRRSLKLKG